MTGRAFCGALLLAAAFSGQGALQAQTAAPTELPDAPQPPGPARFDNAPPALDVAEANGCHDEPSSPRAAAPEAREPLIAELLIVQQDRQGATRPGFPPVSPQPQGKPPASSLGIPPEAPQCVPGSSSLADASTCCRASVNLFAEYLSSAGPFPLTAKQKFILAERNVRDPFNLLTIGGVAAITIANNAHTAYGPGFPGFGKYSGISLGQNAVGTFFGTFLIPALARQDPHYHRMPNRPLKRRIFHVIDSIVIADSDDGQPMFNYATVFGTIGTNAIGNLYVPGRKNSWGASVGRISVSLATDPIGNVISEFLPDVARRINVNVVLVQEVINRVAIEEGAAPPQ